MMLLEHESILFRLTDILLFENSLTVIFFIQLTVRRDINYRLFMHQDLVPSDMYPDSLTSFGKTIACFPAVENYSSGGLHRENLSNDRCTL